MSTCIAVVCDKNYQHYLPIFVLFATSSYPVYGIKIFLQGRLGASTRKGITKLNCEGIDIHEKYIPENITNKQALKTFRWLLDEELFDGFNNIYVGDIDLLICHEEQSLESVHTKHCEANHLPYSNCIRPGTTRLSGLHFVQKVPYYRQMLPLIRRYRDLLFDNAIDFVSTRNENILYRMILESGMGLPKDEHRIDINGSGPHHGLHLGIWRATHKVSDAVANQILSDRYLEHYAFFQQMERRNLLAGRAYKLQEVENMRTYFSTLDAVRLA